ITLFVIIKINIETCIFNATIFHPAFCRREELPGMRFSKTEHMVEAEAARAVHKAMEAEKAAGRVPDDHITRAAHARTLPGIEHFRQAPVTRAAAGDLYALLGDGLALGIVQDEQG